MPPTRSMPLRASKSPFKAPGRKSMFSRASGFTINGGTFNISASQPLDSPSLPNRLSRYVEHLEARLAELEDWVDMTTLAELYSYGSISQINLSIENDPHDQPGYGDKTGAPGLPCEDRKDRMDYSGSMSTISSQGTSNSRGSCIAHCHGGFHSHLPATSMSTIPDNAVATAVRDACPICRSSCAERLQAEDTAVVVDGSDKIGTLQL
ncbi:hypothetical protein DFH09DRAFT_1323374 [Mycena vulgaris]|nr:hypothetical protein DFH09DRAFT_1323374 [Mycena vulgaris]